MSEIGYGTKVSGQIGAGALIMNDWVLTLEPITDGYRLTIRKGSDEKSIDLFRLTDEELETLRKAEQGRVDAEALRVIAEKARERAESERAGAETERENAWALLRDQASSATSSANAAAENAQGVASDVQTVIDQFAQPDVTVETLDPGTDATASWSAVEDVPTLVLGIPRGDTGMTAYEYAVAGGYTGTEAEFRALQTATEENAGKAQQALADLLSMMGEDVATLVGGKIPMDQIPATATQEIYEVESADALTSLVAQRGDLAELVETIDGERTITKTWQLLGDDPAVATNWVVWGTSYAVQAGHAATATDASNATMINNHRLVQMDSVAWETAVKDANTYYLIYDADSGEAGT